MMTKQELIDILLPFPEDTEIKLTNIVTGYSYDITHDVDIESTRVKDHIEYTLFAHIVKD